MSSVLNASPRTLRHRAPGQRFGTQKSPVQKPFRPLLALVLAAIPLLPAPAVAAPPRAARAYSGAGFDSPGFNSGGFNAPARGAPGFNAQDFNGHRFRPGDEAVAGCGRMVVPAASLAQMSRGFGGDHAGMDLAAEHGSPIRAATAGTISYMGNDPAYGLFIDITHAGNLMTRYGHLSAFTVGLLPGSAVRAGTVIGRVGATGNAHGAHLHFEVRSAGRAIDPKPFLVGADCPAGRPEVLEARAPDRPRPAAR